MRDGPRVFLSYAHDDQAYADRLRTELAQYEIAVFPPPSGLASGESIVSALRSTIVATDVFVMLLSPDAVKSQWVRKEFEYVISTELRQRLVTVVPVKVRPCQIPKYLANLTVIDATRDFRKAISSLTTLLRSAPLVQFERLDPRMFEMLIGDLLRAYGFKLVEPASISGEGGFDFVAQSSMKDPFGRSEVVDWIVEARATRGPTSVHSLRAFLGVLSQRRERGLFVTSGQLTSLARDWLQQVARDGGPQISLIEGPEIKRLIVAKPNLLTKYFGGHGEA